MKEKIKILWIGDGVTPTGFGTVNHNIIQELPEDEFEVHHLAINYHGDPHNYTHAIYPAASPRTGFNDMYGVARIEELVHKVKPNMIFILNDIWILDVYLEHIKTVYKGKDLPKIVVYFPVDGYGYQQTWFQHFDIVSRAVVYTEFAKKTVLDASPEIAERLEVIPHGTNLKDFYKFENKLDAKEEILEPIKKTLDIENSFIVLNANRNQPRKRLDLSLLGFAHFALEKPPTVRYYHHAGVQDAGWNLFQLIERIEKRFEDKGLYKPWDLRLHQRIIITNLESLVQQVSIEKLNAIYNATDIGVNTSLGEGWGLTATEHAVSGVPQVVPQHTACAELFEDCGLLIPIKQTVFDTETLLDRDFPDPLELAKHLETLYTNEELRNSLGQKGLEKFTSEEYQWSNIAKSWKKLFIETLQLGEQND
jgi:glycosyltransferase involved in cell wall biosynthesis